MGPGGHAKGYKRQAHTKDTQKACKRSARIYAGKGSAMFSEPVHSARQQQKKQPLDQIEGLLRMAIFFKTLFNIIAERKETVYIFSRDYYTVS
ncbi:hypothetical protein R70723_20965 [Paenibacillus sp. FSL R7-0273]|nr:hypothetical protein R70723_20965 [Paenibacillus sp. FSL R7-0273]OMF85179.1 hypothetical protein BK144_28340 [Paenibacillus sp. FSL R7-0273]